MIRLAALALLLSGAAAAQPALVLVASEDAGTLLVDGSPTEVAVERPGVRAVRVEAGARTVSLVDDPAAWNPRRADVDLTLAPGDTVSLALHLPVRTRVETLPLGATLVLVRADGSRQALGASPAVVDLPPGETARVEATLEGHFSAESGLPGAPTVSLLLPPVGAPNADPVSLLPMRQSTRTRTLVDIGIGAATLAAGAFAVTYKARADRLDDDFNGTGALRANDDLRKDIERNDRISTVGLVGMQVGLGVLAVRFMLR